MPINNITCNCGYEARTKTQLDIHIKKCIKIKLESVEGDEDVNLNESICKHCKKILSSKYNCDRHMKTCKKNQNAYQMQNESNQEEENFMKDSLKYMNSIDKQLHLMRGFYEVYNTSDKSEKLIIQQTEFYKSYKNMICHLKNSLNDNISINQLLQPNTSNSSITTSNSHNTTNQTNSHNQTNNNIDNSQTTINNNNNTNFNMVYPFGFENIYFLTPYEMVDILTSKNCIIAALEKIFSNVENRNFMKRNMNREQMTVIDENCNIKVMNDDAFKRKTIKNTFSALQMMFYHCKNMLKIEHQIMLWQNLRLLNELIKENITTRDEKYMCNDIKQIMDTITNMVSENNENPEYREKFAEIKNSITSEEYKRLFNEKLNTIIAKMAAFNADYQSRHINMDYVRNNIWNRNLDTDPQLSLDNQANHIDMHDIETTPRFMFFKDMEMLENDYLRKPSNDTIGNIDSLCNVREKVANGEFKKYQDKFKPKIKEVKTLERQIKNSKKFNARDKMPENKPGILKDLPPTAKSVAV